MARIKVPYYIVRTGKRGGVRRFWQPGKQVRLLGWRMVRLADHEPTAIDQARAINAALATWRRGQKAEPTAEHQAIVLAAAPVGAVLGDNRVPGEDAPRAARPGTLGALIRAYRMHEDFRSLRPKTKRDYECHLRTLEAWGGDAPLSVLTPKRFRNLWRERHAKAPVSAHGCLRVARNVLNWGRREDLYVGYLHRGTLVPMNAAAELNLPTVRPERTEDDLWTPEEVQIFAAEADLEGWPSIGLAVELNEWMGQRRGDVLTARADAFKDGSLAVRQSKRGARVWLPLDDVPHLKERLEAERRRRREAKITATTLLVCDSTGQPWKEDHFAHKFAEIRTAASAWCPSLAKKQFLLLRHTAVTRLAEAGCTIDEIAAITGHSRQSVSQILERYGVRTRQLARNAFRKRLAAQAEENEPGEKV